MLKICVVVKCKPFLHGLPNQVLNPVWTYTFKRQVKDVLCVLPIHLPFGCLADSFMPGHFGLKQVQVGVWAYGLRMGDRTLNILTTGLHHTLYVLKCFTHCVCVCVFPWQRYMFQSVFSMLLVHIPTGECGPTGGDLRPLTCSPPLCASPCQPMWS